MREPGAALNLLLNPAILRHGIFLMILGQRSETAFRWPGSRTEDLPGDIVRHGLVHGEFAWLLVGSGSGTENLPGSRIGGCC